MSIVKNTIYLTLSYIVQKVLALIYFIILARFLGPEEVGKYVFAVSLAMAFSIFSDLGLTSVFIREVAKDREKLKNYLGNIIGLKLILAVFTFLILIITIFYLNKSPLIIVLVALAGIAVLFESFANFFYGIFRAYQDLRYESWGVILHQLFLLVLSLVILFLEPNLSYLMIAYMVAGFLYFLLPLVYLIKFHQIKIQFKIDKKITVFLFKIALPFALAGFFNRLFTYVDTISLGKLVGNIYVGWYSVASKLDFSLYFIPAAFSAVIFPAFSSLYHSSKERMVEVFEKSLFYLMIIALPISSGTIFLAKELILKIYGQDYLPAIVPLQILMTNLIFMFLYTPLGALLNATDRQLKNTLNIGAAALVNLTLNLILIPVFYHRGMNPASAASLTSLISNIILFSLGFYLTRKIIIWHKIYLFKNFVKSFIAALIMGLAVFNLKGIIPLLPLIFLGGLIYLIVLYLIKGINREDFNFLAKKILRRSI